MLRIKRYTAGLLAALLLLGSPFALANTDQKEYLVKAAFIYNFVKFVEWPGDYSITKRSSINVCIIGTNPFEDSLMKVLKKASSSQLSLNVAYINKWQGSASQCHIAFISESESDNLDTILSVLKQTPVLTVSEIEGFAERGGIIGFVKKDQKVKLVVNTLASGRANLRIDAQLLEIALQVIR